jgi:aspartyl-tRNA(Asn)/glutamyl-tRNA(Gln) amidotransferase subunit A
VDVTNDAPWTWSLRHARDSIASAQISPVEVTQSVLDRIVSRREVNAYITVSADRALDVARSRSQAVKRRQPLGALHGVPIALKDNIATAGVRTTAGSPLLETWVPSEDAAVVTKLEEAGAILLGKNNLYELAFGAAHPRFGETLNPWRGDLTCGGSSSGSAAAVADGQAHGAIATDTGGSIRIPAAMCGVVGLKPTFGLISNYGVIPVSAGLDVVGPLARSVDDAELLWNAISGASSLREHDARRTKVGLPTEQEGTEVAPEIAAALEIARKRLEETSHRVEEVEIPDLFLIRDAMWTIASAEIAEYHREALREHPNQLCEAVRRNLLAGALIPAGDYIRALRLRQEISRKLTEILSSFDVLLMGSVPMSPYRIGEKEVETGRLVEPVLQALMRFTPLANLTGQPAIVVPVARPPNAPPLTVQLFGRHHEEPLLFQVARILEHPEVSVPE